MLLPVGVAQDVPRLLGRSEGIDGATHDIDNTKIAEEMVQNLDMNVRRTPSLLPPFPLPVLSFSPEKGLRFSNGSALLKLRLNPQAVLAPARSLLLTADQLMLGRWQDDI
eukprot:COSAG04_NODE_5514_length_1589_cov_1.302013_2_plen_110_part_00